MNTLNEKQIYRKKRYEKCRGKSISL